MGEVTYFRVGGEKGAAHPETRYDPDCRSTNVMSGAEIGPESSIERFNIGHPCVWCLGMPVSLSKSDEACAC